MFASKKGDFGRILTVAVLAASLAACDKSSPQAIPPTEPTVAISATPSSVISGNAATITWSSTDTTACTASGAWSGTRPTSGSEAVTPTSVGSASYTLTCSGPGGTTTATSVVTVVPPPSIASFAITPNGEVATGAELTADWLSVTTSACTATSNLGGTWSGAMPTSGPRTFPAPALAGEYVFALSCTASDGSGEVKATPLTLKVVDQAGPRIVFAPRGATLPIVTGARGVPVSFEAHTLGATGVHNLQTLHLRTTQVGGVVASPDVTAMVRNTSIGAGTGPVDIIGTLSPSGISYTIPDGRITLPEGSGGVPNVRIGINGVRPTFTSPVGLRLTLGSPDGVTSGVSASNGTDAIQGATSLLEINLAVVDCRPFISIDNQGGTIAVETQDCGQVSSLELTELQFTVNTTGAGDASFTTWTFTGPDGAVQSGTLVQNGDTILRLRHAPLVVMGAQASTPTAMSFTMGGGTVGNVRGGIAPVTGVEVWTEGRKPIDYAGALKLPTPTYVTPPTP